MGMLNKTVIPERYPSIQATEIHGHGKIINKGNALTPGSGSREFVSSHNPAEAEHGHIHGYQDHGDQKSDEHDQGGFEERPHAFDLEFEFLGECFALSSEHFGQAVGLFADTDEGREFAVVQGVVPGDDG